jgi:hypothetical protein
MVDLRLLKASLSVKTGTFPISLEQDLVLHRLKKPTLRPDTLGSHRPISNLSFISKVLKRANVRRITSFASERSLFPVIHSAFCTFH